MQFGHPEPRQDIQISLYQYKAARGAERLRCAQWHGPLEPGVRWQNAGCTRVQVIETTPIHTILFDEIVCVLYCGGVEDEAENNAEEYESDAEGSVRKISR